MQCGLYQEFRAELEEKDHIISTLNTKVGGISVADPGPISCVGSRSDISMIMLLFIEMFKMGNFKKNMYEMLVSCFFYFTLNITGLLKESEGNTAGTEVRVEKIDLYFLSQIDLCVQVGLLKESLEKVPTLDQKADGKLIDLSLDSGLHEEHEVGEHSFVESCNMIYTYMLRIHINHLLNSQDVHCTLGTGSVQLLSNLQNILQTHMLQIDILYIIYFAVFS